MASRRRPKMQPYQEKQEAVRVQVRKGVSFGTVLHVVGWISFVNFFGSEMKDFEQMQFFAVFQFAYALPAAFICAISLKRFNLAKGILITTLPILFLGGLGMFCGALDFH